PDGARDQGAGCRPGRGRRGRARGRRRPSAVAGVLPGGGAAACRRAARGRGAPAPRAPRRVPGRSRSRGRSRRPGCPGRPRHGGGLRAVPSAKVTPARGVPGGYTLRPMRRRALRTFGPTLAALGLAVGLAVPTVAIGLNGGPRTTANTMAVEVIVPGGAGAQAGANSAGSYPDAIVSVGSFSSG